MTQMDQQPGKLTDVLLPTTSPIEVVDTLLSIDLDIETDIRFALLIEREFHIPKSRTPMSAYTHIANDDQAQLPQFSYSRADRVGMIVGMIAAAAAIVLAVLAVLQ